MKNNIQIKIDSPCTENWNLMDDRACGKFCQSCSKIVFDFSNLNDLQLRKILDDNPNGICARAKESQLNRDIPKLPEKSWLNRLIPSFIVSLISLSAPQIVRGQADSLQYFIEQGQPICSEPQSDLMEATRISQKEIELSDSIRILSNRTIVGKVIDGKTGNFIPHATVVISGTTIGTSTDTTGAFHLKIPDSIKEDTLEISISSIGFETIRKTVFLDSEAFVQNEDVTSIIRIDPVLFNQISCFAGVVSVSKRQMFFYRLKFWKRWDWF